MTGSPTCAPHPGILHGTLVPAAASFSCKVIETWRFILSVADTCKARGQ